MPNDKDRAREEIQEFVDALSDKNLMTVRDAACGDEKFMRKLHESGLIKHEAVTDAPDLADVACEVYQGNLTARGYPQQNPSDKTHTR